MGAFREVCGRVSCNLIPNMNQATQMFGTKDSLVRNVCQNYNFSYS